MFGANNTKTLTIPFNYDPAADDDLYVFKAPQQIEIVSASFACNNAVAASTANYFDLALYNGGTAGTATTAIAGTIGGTVGWSALTPKDFTVSNGTVTANQIVYLRYNEEGTGTFTAGVLQINYCLGQA
jgi:hypothetical protein